MKKVRHLLRWLKYVFHIVRFGGRFSGAGRNFLSCGTVDIHPGGRIVFGNGNWFERGYTLAAVGGRIRLGSRNYFNKNVKLVCYDALTIGDDCLFGDSVHIYDQDHNFSDLQKPISQQGYVTRPVTIGNNVWIGAKATILKGVTIGDGAIIGANALVARDIPPNAIVVGNPAAIIKMRS